MLKSTMFQWFSRNEWGCFGGVHVLALRLAGGRKGVEVGPYRSNIDIPNTNQRAHTDRLSKGLYTPEIHRHSPSFIKALLYSIYGAVFRLRP